MARCYNCGIDLDSQNRTTEHIPAKNLYAGFSPDYIQNRITVPACLTCHNGFSYIDDEIKGLIGIGNNDLTAESVMTQKTVSAIMRKSNWMEGAIFDAQRKAGATGFGYEDLKKMYIQHFKGLFCHQYSVPIPSNYQIEIVGDGEEDLNFYAQLFYDLLTSKWEISGHRDIFNYMLKAITLDYNTGNFEECSSPENATFIGVMMQYNRQPLIIVVASTEEYLEANKDYYGY